MHVIVVGCGRVGSTIARELAAEDHDVVVVDRRSEAFRRLGSDFAGRTLTGIGFDRDLLQSAGITEHSAVLAVTSGDNSNILIARVARETFGVQRVVARIYDPKRAVIYERLGIATVATVAWTAARAIRLVVPDPTATDWIDPTSRFALVERRVPGAAAGTTLAELAERGVGVTLVSRNSQVRLAAPATIIQQDDVLHIMVATEHLDSIDHLLLHEGSHR